MPGLYWARSTLIIELAKEQNTPEQHHQCVFMQNQNAQRKWKIGTVFSFETEHNKKWQVRQAKTKISLGIRTVFRVRLRKRFGSKASNKKHSQDSDQTQIERMNPGRSEFSLDAHVILLVSCAPVHLSLSRNYVMFSRGRLSETASEGKSFLRVFINSFDM